MDWRDEYRGKLISAEDAAQMVKSGDQVVFTLGREAFAIGLALAARKEELKDVKVTVGVPGYDFGWYDDGWQDSFTVALAMPTATCQEAVDNRRCDFWVSVPIAGMQTDAPPDFLFTEVSSPDEKGFCSFGNSVWDKKRQIRRTREGGQRVIAEVNENLMRTYGENFVHVSELDYLVEHAASGDALATGSLAGRPLKETPTYVKEIAKYANSLIKDGDTIQIGVGRTTEPLVRLGLLEGKNDIGMHSEATPPGIVSLVKQGVINGRRKTVLPNRVVVTSIGGSTREEMAWVHMNPLFHLVEYEWLEDLRVIAANDNMTAINNALMVDITGQITAESIGTRLLSAPGGQPPFVFGALQANGGKSITILPSVASNGASRIVPFLPEGTSVTIPRGYADNVITEYGIARLRGKTLRQRTEELIAIAHPSYREELRQEAQRRLWP